MNNNWGPSVHGGPIYVENWNVPGCALGGWGEERAQWKLIFARKQTMGGLHSYVNESNGFFSVRAPTMKIKNYSFQELAYQNMQDPYYLKGVQLLEEAVADVVVVVGTRLGGPSLARLV